MLATTSTSLAQEISPFADVNVDDLGNVSDEFQENFFEALKQKGIENYDRALIALDACIAIAPQRAVLYFEKGKNHLALKQYPAAARAFQKTLDLDGAREDVFELLYEVYYAQQDTEQAEAVLLKLIGYDDIWKEHLVRLYTATGRYEEGLALLDELERDWGKDAYRNSLRQEIYDRSTDKSAQINRLTEQISTNPKNEEEYLKLIYLYTEQGAVQKAFDTAQELLKVNPESKVVHLALYKFYLEDGNTDDAVASMQEVLKSDKITAQVKHKVLNDFLLFVNENPDYEPELEEAVKLFAEEEVEIDIYQSLAAYYKNRGDTEQALNYYQLALLRAPDNLVLIKETLALQMELGHFEQAIEGSKNALELYPAQPMLYLIYGNASLETNQSDQAVESLLYGLDYVFDNPSLESAFYKALERSYGASGQQDKAEEYRKKAAALTQ
ncbi:tetratricopeptide repeat protein [Croceiramulus getboli]|nr:tetratricopeptide repeat protein [Flavobacteriaceae bacterium YJPT1-3]